jgi:O-antigen ligase
MRTTTVKPKMAAASQLGWWRRDNDIVDSTTVVTRGAESVGSPVAFAALVGFTVVMVLAPQQFVPVLAPMRLAFVFAIVAIASQIFAGSASTMQPMMPLELKLLAALVGVAMLSIPTSYWPTGSVNTLTQQYLKSVAIFWLVGAAVTAVSRLRALLWTLALTAMPLALVGVNNYLSGSFVRDRVVGYDSGLASNPNDLALTLNLFIPLTVMLGVTSKRLWLQALAWSGAAASVVAVLMTLSRAGFLTLVAEIALIVLFLVRRRALGALATLALLGSITLVVLPAGYVSRVGTIFNIQSDPTGSAQERWRDTQAAMRFVGGHPIIGAGVGVGILAMNETRGALWIDVHNAYLNYAVDLGLPGLLLFLALMATCYRSARRVERQPSNLVGEDLPAFAAAIRISLIGFVVAAFFHPVPYHFYFYYVAGLCVALKTTAAQQFGVRIS